MPVKKVTMLVNSSDKIGHIHPEIYGHFSEHLGRCIYEGIYVGENSEIPNIEGMRTDIIDAFRNIKVPVLRWPGGCFADEYHWKDGQAPAPRQQMASCTPSFCQPCKGTVSPNPRSALPGTQRQ